jgi:hypothetical protein
MAVVAKPCDIVIRMTFERSLGACCRAICGRSELLVSLWPLDIIQGDAPMDVREKVLAWAAQHQQELFVAWKHGLSGLSPKPVPAFSPSYRPRPQAAVLPAAPNRA